MTVRKIAKQSTIALAAAALLAGPGVASSMAAPADPPSASATQAGPVGEDGTLTADAEGELRAYFDRYDVSTADQESLIADLEAGEAWDSFDQESEPISSVESTDADGAPVTVDAYGDGSIAVRGVSAGESGDGSALGVSGCSKASPNGTVTGCYANVDLGVVQKGFNFDYRGNTITRSYAMQHRIIGGALSNHRFEEISASDRRYASDFSVAFKGFPVGWTAYMGVRLTADGPVTYNN